MKFLFTLLLLISFFVNVNSQEKKLATFGETTIHDREISQYEKDPEAAAIVLFEKGKVSVKLNRHRYLVLNTDVHIKIKVLDAKKFEEDATINLLFYQTKKNQEIIDDLKAITHNNDKKIYVEKSHFFRKDLDKNYSEISFTFPDVRDGSILEYTYTQESPFFHQYGWEFQGKYPKLYSEFISEIPGNYEYRTSLSGQLDFAYKDSYIKDNCFSVDGFGDAADCVYSEFVMKDIPAFKEEDFMLSKNNYISRIKYDLKETMSFTGEKTFYTKTWEDVDKELRFHDHLGRQIGFNSYFKNRIPENILGIQNTLERAKAIYYYIQDNFFWNGEYNFYESSDVKEAFEKKGGNIAEMNIILLNALNAAEIEANLALSATRNLGLPTLIYPTLTEFNYVTVYLKIDGKEYYLDATNKFTPFGVIPFKALNKIARIMDFKNESYWHPITPYSKNVNYINAKLNLDENGVLNGVVEENHSGYFAESTRAAIYTASKDEYINDRENDLLAFEISNHSLENLNKNDEPVKEEFNITLENELIGDEIFINPFFLSKHYNKNPFNLNNRVYEVEMGYPINQILLVNMEFDESYTISYLPENSNIKLPNNAGAISVVYLQNDNKLNIRLQLKINQVSFEPELYPSLKEFFSKVVELKTKSSIVLKKT